MGLSRQRCSAQMWMENQTAVKIMSPVQCGVASRLTIQDAPNTLSPSGQQATAFSPRAEPHPDQSKQSPRHNQESRETRQPRNRDCSSWNHCQYFRESVYLHNLSGKSSGFFFINWKIKQSLLNRRLNKNSCMPLIIGLSFTASGSAGFPEDSVAKLRNSKGYR